MADTDKVRQKLAGKSQPNSCWVAEYPIMGAYSMQNGRKPMEF
jgi:hypothetical protein